MRKNHDLLFAFAALFTASMGALVFAPGIARSAPISFTINGEEASPNSSGRRPPAPGGMLFLTSEAVTLNLPSPEPDDMDRVINYQLGDPPSYEWIVRADNADDFGFDWEAFQDSLNGPDKTVTLRFRDATNNTIAFKSIGGAISEEIGGPGPYELADFAMDEIRVVVDYYFWHPILPGLRATSISFEIDGSGEVVPEPSSLALMLLTSLTLVAWRRIRTEKA